MVNNMGDIFGFSNITITLDHGISENNILPGRNGLTLHHYDFYRLSDAGIIADELAETIHDHHAITVIEWGDSIKSVLPAEHITIKINHRADQGREVEIHKIGQV